MEVSQLQNIFHLDRHIGFGSRIGSRVYPSGPSTENADQHFSNRWSKTIGLSSHSLPLCASPTSQNKTGREFEGSSFISAAGGAVPFTSLDSKEHHRDSPRDAHRINQCGKLTLRGVKPDSSVASLQLPCKCWHVPVAGCEASVLVTSFDKPLNVRSAHSCSISR